MSAAAVEPSSAARLVRSSSTVALGTLLSRLTGLARVAVLAYAIGQASLADSYNLANTTPNIVYELLIGGVLSATLVPVFVDHLQRRDDRGTSAVFTVTLTVLVGLTAIAMVFAPQIARLYSLDASGDERAARLEVMTFLIRCFLPQMCFYGFTALASALLNARRRFAAAAYAPVLNNVVVVCVLLAFIRLAAGPQENWTNVERIQGDDGLLLLLGIGTTAGIAAMALVLVPAVAAGAHLRFVFDWRNAAVRQVVRLSGWTVGYVVANQVALLIVLVLAATRDGNVTAYQYAFIFFQLPHGLFAVSIMTTTTPELARHYAARNLPAMRDDFTLGLRYMLLVVVPSAVGLAVLAQPALSVLATGRGGFDASDATLTADTLQAFALGLVPFSVYLFALRGFYAQQNTRTPFLVNVFENAGNILLALALFPALGVRGLALAYSGAYVLAAVVALVLLTRRIGDLLPPEVLATAVRSLIGAAALGVVAGLTAGAIGRDTPTRAALAVAAGATTGALAYVGTLAALRADELRGLLRAIRRRGATDADV